MIIRDHIVDGGRLRDSTEVICIHRVSRARDERPAMGIKPIADDKLTGPLVADWYSDERPMRPGSATGGKMPAAFVVLTDGTIDQCRPLMVETPHAFRWNSRALSVAVIGDFREWKPTDIQVHAAEKLCGLLVAAFGAEVRGHDELPDGSKIKTKNCPGGFFPLAQVRAEATRIAKSMSKSDAQMALGELGVR